MLTVTLWKAVRVSSPPQAKGCQVTLLVQRRYYVLSLILISFGQKSKVLVVNKNGQEFKQNPPYTKLQSYFVREQDGMGHPLSLWGELCLLLLSILKA